MTDCSSAELYMWQLCGSLLVRELSLSLFLSHSLAAIAIEPSNKDSSAHFLEDGVVLVLNPQYAICTGRCDWTLQAIHNFHSIELEARIFLEVVVLRKPQRYFHYC